MAFKWAQQWQHFQEILQWISDIKRQVETQEHRRKIKFNKIKSEFSKTKDWSNPCKMPFNLRNNNFDQLWLDKYASIKYP